MSLPRMTSGPLTVFGGLGIVSTGHPLGFCAYPGTLEVHMTFCLLTILHKAHIPRMSHRVRFYILLDTVVARRSLNQYLRLHKQGRVHKNHLLTLCFYVGTFVGSILASLP